MQMLPWQDSFHLLCWVELWHGATDHNQVLVLLQQGFQLVTRSSLIKKRVCCGLCLRHLIILSSAHFKHKLSLRILARVQSPRSCHLLSILYSIKNNATALLSVHTRIHAIQLRLLIGSTQQGRKGRSVDMQSVVGDSGRIDRFRYGQSLQAQSAVEQKCGCDERQCAHKLIYAVCDVQTCKASTGVGAA